MKKRIGLYDDYETPVDVYLASDSGIFYTPEVKQEPIPDDPINIKYVLPGNLPVEEPEVVPTTATIRSDLLTAYVEGLVLDSVTNEQIPVTIQIIVPETGATYGEPFYVADGYYSAWTDQDINRVAVKFVSKGYKDKVVLFSELVNEANVLLEKGTSIPMPVIIGAIAVAAYFLMRKKKKRTLGAVDTMQIFLIVGGIVGFSLIQKTLQFLGIWESQDTKDLDAQAGNPNSYWSPNYWQTIKPSGASWSYAITDTTAREWAQEIVNAFGWINDCEECVIAVAKRCRTKANFSFLCDIFQQEYGEDMLKYLRGGWWPQDRLSDADVNEINTYISRLPNY